MKTFRCFAFAAACGFLILWSRGHAEQTVIFSGHITSATGIYEDQYSAGELVVLSLDFSHTFDVWNGTQPGLATYFPIAQFTIDGQLLPLASLQNPTLGASLIRQSSRQGLFIGNAWGHDDDARVFFQNVIATHDVGATRNIFPGGVPFDEFSSTDGSFQNYFVTDGKFNYRGTINWQMENYVGSLDLPVLPDPPPPPPLHPIPEPATYGLFGALGLGVFAACRRHKEFFRSTLTVFS